ncbi:MAG: hypothetical protein K6G03_09930 [Lachnospiraceae bacterium]|nr:hypothetical protein [Lachnospiraceae bacterium]
MNKASLKSFHSTSEFGKGFYKNHCGPTAITNLIITDRQLTDDRIVLPEECREIFESVASYGRKHLIYNRKYGTTDVFLWLFVKAAFKLWDCRLTPGHRHTLTPKNAKKYLSKGSFLLVEEFGHPKYGWHQMVIYGTDEKGRYITADGFESSPVLLDDKTLGRGLFLEIKHSAR